MAGETIITQVGNLTAEPELRFTSGNVPVVSFTVASTEKRFDRESNSWKDADALFLRCTAWRDLAEHIAGSLHKGLRVIVVGRLKQRSYQDREGNPRTSIELEVEEVGPSLRFATADVFRAAGKGGAAKPADQPEQWATAEPGDSAPWDPSAAGDDTPF